MENEETGGIKMLRIKYQGEAVDVLYDPSKGLPKQDVINEAVEKLKEQIAKNKQKELEGEKAKEAREGSPPEEKEKSGTKKSYMDEKVSVVLEGGAGVDIGARDKDLEKTVEGSGGNEDAAKAVEQTQTQLETAVNSEVKQVSLDDGIMNNMQDQLREEDQKQDKQEKPEETKKKEENEKAVQDNERDLKLRDDMGSKIVENAAKTAQDIDKKGGINTSGKKAKVNSQRELVEKIAKASGVSVETLVAKQKGEKVVARPKPKVKPKKQAKGNENKEKNQEEAMRQMFIKNGRYGNSA